MPTVKVPKAVQVIALLLATLVGLLNWALASPVGSAPDDDLHIANMYCIHDTSTCRADDWLWPWGVAWWAPDPADRKGPEYAGAKRTYRDLWRYRQPRELPCYVTNGSTWYAPDPSVAATCLNEEARADNRPASLDNLSHYPSVYYRIMSVLTQDTIRQSVVVWRIANILLAMLILTGSIVLSARRYRRAIAVGVLVASMPLGLFLISSTNPSSWLIIGTAGFLGPALSLMRERGSPWLLVARIGLLVTCLLLMVAGRSEGRAHAAVLVVVALLLGLKAHRAVYALLGSAAIVLGPMAFIALSRSQGEKGQRAVDLFWAGLHEGFVWDALLSVPHSFFGGDAFRLGWLDVIPPQAAIIAANAAFWGTFVLGVAVMFWRKGITLVLVAVALIGVSASRVAGSLVAGVSIAQPTRYFLPLVYMLAFIALVPDWGKWLPRWSNAQWIALGGALSIANSLSLLYLTVRYVSGIQPGTTNPKNLAATPSPDWWWDAWLGPFGNWLLGTVAFAVAVGLLFTLPSIREGAEDHLDEDAPEQPDGPYHQFWNPPAQDPAPLSSAR